jgi:glycosyltransferase involved in cell wall biosynthesis
MKVLHVITGLTRGGAETFLCRLIERSFSLDREIKSSVVVLGGADPVLLARIRKAGAQVDVLHGTGRSSFPLILFQLYRRMCAIRPDLIQGWMYDGNLAASLAGRLAGLDVFWNVRRSLHSAEKEKLSTRLAILASRLLSGNACATVYNSHMAERQHANSGFRSSRTLVIPNGFDFNSFFPDERGGQRLREALGIPAGAFVFGNVARLHPMKSHDLLIEAFAGLQATGEPPHLVIAGDGNPERRQALTVLAARLGVTDRVHLLGLRDDVPELLRSFHGYVCSSSWGEAFPNAVGEAMVSGVPCIVTEVGDSSLLVGDTGFVVPPGLVPELGAAMQKILLLRPEQRSALGGLARARVMRHWGLDGVVRQYLGLYKGAADFLAGNRRRRPDRTRLNPGNGDPGIVKVEPRWT